MRVPAGTVIAAARAGLAEATISWLCGSGLCGSAPELSGCVTPACCARQLIDTKMEAKTSALTALLCLIFVLFKNERERRRRFGDISDTSLQAGLPSVALAEP